MPTPTSRTNRKHYPGFRATYHRAPVAGIDYDADGTLSRDDYEFLTDSGAYAPEPEPQQPQPAPASVTAKNPQPESNRVEMTCRTCRITVTTAAGAPSLPFSLKHATHGITYRFFTE